MLKSRNFSAKPRCHPIAAQANIKERKLSARAKPASKYDGLITINYSRHMEHAYCRLARKRDKSRRSAIHKLYKLFLTKDVAPQLQCFGQGPELLSIDLAQCGEKHRS